MAEERQKVIDTIVEELKNKKNPNTVDEFIIMIYDSKGRGHKDLNKMYDQLINDLMKIEKLKEEQNKLFDGLAEKYAVHMMKTPKFLVKMHELQLEIANLKKSEDAQRTQRTQQTQQTQQTENPVS